MFSLLMYFVRNDKNKDDQSFKQYEAGLVCVSLFILWPQVVILIYWLVMHWTILIPDAQQDQIL